MDGARPRAAPSGIAPGRTERAADHAVTVLYRSHYAALVRETALLVGDFATAEDVVQDCFIALHRAWWRVRDTSAAQFYLRRSMINKSRSVLRRRVVADRHPVMSEPALPSAEESALAVVQVSLVRAALGALPVRQREVLVLRYYADLSETQIAAVMGINLVHRDGKDESPRSGRTPQWRSDRAESLSVIQSRGRVVPGSPIPHGLSLPYRQRSVSTDHLSGARPRAAMREQHLLSY
jgi:RNA polymerase sigma factor (sigma-70 family)